MDRRLTLIPVKTRHSSSSKNPVKYTVVCTPGGFDQFFREAAGEFKTPKPDFPTLVKIGVKYGIQIEAPPAS
jgi:hypothetical protein